jgi:WD40 repeat protein
LHPAFESAREGFFVSGGTVPLGSPSYVERTADSALLEALYARKFCYVLNSRQMGKSSLCVRTMARLQGCGVRPAFIDLTKIGGRNVTPAQWYAGLLVETGRALGLRAEMLRKWQEDSELSPMQRFFSALRDVALERLDAPVVIFIDEIDATRSLSFSADEFFAGIREAYNRRVQDPAFERLTFCLLGVAVPGDLIADTTTTPFNIGERIVLADFTESEAMPLAAGLGANGADLLRRILYWTHGHPFLTQSLAASAGARDDVRTAADVDRLVAELLFQAKSRDTNINLADVGNRILGGAPDPEQAARYRADILSLYESVWKGREVFDDESNRLAAILKLSGVVRVEDRRLELRNRIYERVFDRAWIRENMPGAELRRQRRAVRKGVLQTAAVAVVVLAVIAALALRAVRERRRADYEVYVASMNLMRPVWEEHNIERIRRLLDATRDNPARGWEWDYWYRMSHLYLGTVPMQIATTTNPRYAPNGKIYLREQGRIQEYSPDTGAFADIAPMTGNAAAAVFPFPDGTRLLESDGLKTAQVIDIAGRRRLARTDDLFLVHDCISPDGRWVVGGRMVDLVPGPDGGFRSAVIWNTETGETRVVPTQGTMGSTISPDGTMLATIEIDRSGPSPVRLVRIRHWDDWKVLAEFHTVTPPSEIIFSPDSRRFVITDSAGNLQMWDVKTREELARVHESDGVVSRVEFSRDGAWMAAISATERVGRLYDVTGPAPRLIGVFNDAAAMSIAPDKKRVLASYQSDIRFYDPAVSSRTPGARVGTGAVDAVQLRPAQGRAYAIAKGALYEVDPLRGESRRADWPSAALLTLPPVGQRLALARGAGGVLQLLDVNARRVAVTLPAGTPLDFFFQEIPPDGSHVAVLHLNKTAEVRETATWRYLSKVPVDRFASAAATSPDSHFVVSAWTDRTFSVRDPATWKERIVPRSGRVISSIFFSPDSKRLLAGTDGDTAEIWDTASWTLLGVLIGHSQPPRDISYSPDGKRIITAGDKTIRIWDASTYRELTTLSGHAAEVLQARFTPDGKSILSIDRNGEAKIWQSAAAAEGHK